MERALRWLRGSSRNNSVSGLDGCRRWQVKVVLAEQMAGQSLNPVTQGKRLLWRTSLGSVSNVLGWRHLYHLPTGRLEVRGAASGDGCGPRGRLHSRPHLGRVTRAVKVSGMVTQRKVSPAGKKESGERGPLQRSRRNGQRGRSGVGVGQQ